MPPTKARKRAAGGAPAKAERKSKLAKERLFAVHPADEPLISLFEECYESARLPPTFDADVRRLVAAGAKPARCHALHHAMHPTFGLPIGKGNSGTGPAEIRLLVQLGCEVNSLDKHGLTPLHWASSERFDPTLARTLIELGADRSAKNPKTGATPYDLTAAFIQEVLTLPMAETFPRENLGESLQAAWVRHGFKDRKCDDWEDKLYELLMLLLDPATMLPMKLHHNGEHLALGQASGNRYECRHD